MTAATTRLDDRGGHYSIDAVKSAFLRTPLRLRRSIAARPIRTAQMGVGHGRPEHLLEHRLLFLGGVDLLNGASQIGLEDTRRADAALLDFAKARGVGALRINPVVGKPHLLLQGP